ncbi:YhgE/Pip domain-containing protein [Aeromicrobium sp. 50.2.37]|uniref:YhgE/Pip domain-containing protein n=1 Tax=Aeromicrobium sp. 50.2.37 TaxID=2969305 RepID=UPI00214F65FD|nr:YhgE/Pip domain-containing protein [Aeromicrobium sp. 50.2.37]MCR4511712.1 YhgE/Pip domain-containing protein [Aeromicrobium sp. 50.2.37]
MFPSPSLPWFELARFRRSRITRAAVLAVAIVPLFYGALYIWANLDPTGRLDNVQAAVVNEDEMIEVAGQDGEKQPVAVGRELAANLIGDDSRNNYDWLLTDAADARAGLADGTYKAVLTIPKDLSKAATSTSGDPSAAVQGRLDLKTNDAVNFVNGQIADRILDAAKSSLNAQVTETYLGNLYLGFTDIKASLEEAADGAGQLADGAGELGDGANQLSDGTAQLADGATTLADGTRRLATGANQLDDGVGQLAGGLGQLEDRTAPLPGQTEQLADGAEQVATGVAGFDRIVQQVVGAITGSTDEIDERLGTLEQSLRDAATACRESGAPAAQCADLDAAADSAATARTQIDGLVGQAGTIGEQSAALNEGARRVADGNRELADNVPALVGAIGDAADGADRLRSGTSQLADGADDAATGADRLADGAGQLTDGANQLADGAGALRDGALELQSGLSDGSEQVPDYTEDERDQLAKTAATPVTDAADRLNKVSSYGEGLAPYFMALALWVGAMSIYLLLRPLSARAVASAAGSVRTALAGFVPGAALSLVQAVLLVGVLLGVVGVGASQPWLLLGLAVLTGLVFTAINQTFIAWFGGAGRFLAIVFVCLQLTAAGGTYPIETSPSFFGFLHSLLPMTYAVHGFRAATAGGTEGVAFDAFVLVVFALLALGATALAAKRRQRVSITRLHPTLQV